MKKLIKEHFYNAYDLNFCSSIALPELLSLDKAIKDISVRVEIQEKLPSQDNVYPDHPYFISQAKAYLYFTEVGTFFINNGGEIKVCSLPGIEEKLVRLPLLGAVLAVLLYQRGKFVLHSSAVSVGGSAVAFVGAKGDGKSTMAAMLCGLGHELLADDVVAVDLSETEEPMILPGFPQFKLYPDSVVTAFNDDPETLPTIASNVNKRSRRAEGFCNLRQPLRSIYVLGESTDIKITQLDSQQAIRFLIANSYMARFTSNWLENGLAVSNLRDCTKIANQIPVYLLERPRDLSKLKDVAREVEKHISTLRESS